NEIARNHKWRFAWFVGLGFLKKHISAESGVFDHRLFATAQQPELHQVGPQVERLTVARIAPCPRRCSEAIWPGWIRGQGRSVFEPHFQFVDSAAQSWRSELHAMLRHHPVGLNGERRLLARGRRRLWRHFSKPHMQLAGAELAHVAHAGCYPARYRGQMKPFMRTQEDLPLPGD